MPDPIINISSTLEAILADCIGNAPEAVKLQDWRGISLRVMRLLEESGLRIYGRPAKADRFTPPGPINRDETVLIVWTYGHMAIINSRGAPMAALPRGLTEQLWRGMLNDALEQLGEAAGRSNRDG